MEYIIRRVKSHELPQLLVLCKNHADYEQASYSLIGKEELLRAELFSENPKLHCFVVEDQSKIVGYFSYTFDFSTWNAQPFLYLDCLYLEPDYRGKKIGETIFNLLTQIAKENNCINIQWQTPDFNEGAIRFYKRMGGTSKNKVRFSLSV